MDTQVSRHAKESRAGHTHLEAQDDPAALEDGEGVAEGGVGGVEGRAVGGVVVYADALAQEPEVVAVQVEWVLLLGGPVRAHAAPAVIPA